jgi:hypothetical protein
MDEWGGHRSEGLQARDDEPSSSTPATPLELDLTLPNRGRLEARRGLVTQPPRRAPLAEPARIALVIAPISGMGTLDRYYDQMYLYSI